MKAKILVYAFTLIIVLGIVFFTLQSGSLRIVLTGSMQPTYNPGDIILIKPPTKPITPGTIITFIWDDKVITHRVVALDGEKLITKGDNNDLPDSWDIYPSDVIGVPFLRIPYLGFLIEFIRTPWGLLLFIGIPVLLIIIDQILEIIRKLKISSGETPS